MWEDKLSEHQLGGSRAVSAAGLQGKGSLRRGAFFRKRRQGNKFFQRNKVKGSPAEIKVFWHGNILMSPGVKIGCGAAMTMGGRALLGNSKSESGEQLTSV